jgi:O-antigen biosynthesis protein WbqP
MAKRIFDLALALLLAPFVATVILACAVAIKLTSQGPVFHMSRRVGKGRAPFIMPKLRTMWVDAPQVATHLLANPENMLTPIGSFLRKTSLDELPQIASVILGEMSFVGPRPALFNQDDLVALREAKGINSLTPGVTGWAQVNGRDEASIPEKVALDEYYLLNRGMGLDLRILAMTAVNAAAARGVRH